MTPDQLSALRAMVKSGAGDALQKRVAAQIKEEWSRTNAAQSEFREELWRQLQVAERFWTAIRLSEMMK